MSTTTSENDLVNQRTFQFDLFQTRNAPTTETSTILKNPPEIVTRTRSNIISFANYFNLQNARVTESIQRRVESINEILCTPPSKEAECGGLISSLPIFKTNLKTEAIERDGLYIVRNFAFLGFREKLITSAKFGGFTFVIRASNRNLVTNDPSTANNTLAEAWTYNDDSKQAALIFTTCKPSRLVDTLASYLARNNITNLSYLTDYTTYEIINCVYDESKNTVIWYNPGDNLIYTFEEMYYKPLLFGGTEDTTTDSVNFSNTVFVPPSELRLLIESELVRFYAGMQPDLKQIIENFQEKESRKDTQIEMKSLTSIVPVMLYKNPEALRLGMDAINSTLQDLLLNIYSEIDDERDFQTLFNSITSSTLSVTYGEVVHFEIGKIFFTARYNQCGKVDVYFGYRKNNVCEPCPTGSTMSNFVGDTLYSDTFYTDTFYTTT